MAVSNNFETELGAHRESGQGASLPATPGQNGPTRCSLRTVMSAAAGSTQTKGPRACPAAHLLQHLPPTLPKSSKPLELSFSRFFYQPLKTQLQVLCVQPSTRRVLRKLCGKTELKDKLILV